MPRIIPLAAALLVLTVAGPAAAQRPSSVRSVSATSSLDGVTRRGTQLARRISVSLDGARRDGETRAARCYSLQLAQVHSLLRQVEHRRAVLARPGTRVELVQRAVGIFRERVDELDRGARTCAGAHGDMTTGTTVTTEIGAAVPAEDATHLPDGDDTRGFPVVLPPPLSPTI